MEDQPKGDGRASQEVSPHLEDHDKHSASSSSSSQLKGSVGQPWSPLSWSTVQPRIFGVWFELMGWPMLAF